MKKRILALALCLVMAVSLLPITAAADSQVTVNSVQFQASGVGPGALGGTPYYGLDGISFSCDLSNGTGIGTSIEGSLILNTFVDPNVTGWIDVDHLITAEPIEGQTYYAYIALVLYTRNDPFDMKLSENFSKSCWLTLPGYETKFVEKFVYLEGTNDYNEIMLVFSIKKENEHKHNWQFTQTDSGNLTATCQNSGCPIGEVYVNLTAHSVTLPDSPFNAKVEVSENFKEAFPNAVIGELVYKYKGADGWTVVEPTAANAKAGEYQVGVRITGLPSNQEVAAFSLEDGADQDGAGYVDLYVKYTAADPAVTAQTGDDRPIEIMMACAAGFSLLAAAAFILDKKRGYSR